MIDDWTYMYGAMLLAVEHDKHDRLVLKTSHGTMTLTPAGDCCSRSWIESVDEQGAIGGVVTDWDYGACEYLDAYGEEKQYFPVLKTTKGRVHIELRNSSNGYYGGWLNTTWSPNGAGD